MSIIATTMAMVTEQIMEPETIIQRFSRNYGQIHGWTSAVTCLFGIPCNLLNIIVLSQPNMIKSPTNLILVGLAFTDLGTMLMYLPIGIYFYILKINIPRPHPDRDTYFWSHFHKFFTMTTVTFHSISIWLTVYLACYRYVFLKTAAPGKNSRPKSRRLKVIKTACEKFFVQCLSFNSTLIGILAITLFAIMFCVPAYLYPEVISESWNPNDNLDNLNYSDKIYNHTSHTVYLIQESELSKTSNGTIWKSMVGSQMIFAKLVPCLLLTTFTLLLIKSLIIINKHKKKLEKMSTFGSSATKDKKLRSKSMVHSPDSRPINPRKTPRRARTKENLRTTLMLIVVCVLFLLTEFPQCVLLIFSIYSPKFYEEVYTPMGDLIDIIALANNSINFLLYCTMSKAFRDTFYKIMSKYMCCLDLSKSQATSKTKKNKKASKKCALRNIKENENDILMEETAYIKVSKQPNSNENSNEMV